MKPEQLSAPAGSPPYVAQLVQNIIRVFQARDGNEPMRLARYSQASALPPARSWQDCICILSDVDGLGNDGLAISNGTNWFNPANGATL